MKDKLDKGTYFELRPGAAAGGGAFPEWHGVQHDTDPGSLPPNHLTAAVNVRFHGEGIVPRPAITPMVTMPSFLDSGDGREQISYLGTHHMQFHSPRLWSAQPGCFPPISGGTQNGSFLRWYNPDKTPDWQNSGAYPALADRYPSIGSYSGDLYFGDWAVLQRPTVLESMRAEVFPSTVGMIFTEQVLGFPLRDLGALQEFDGKLFIALRDITDSGGSTVATWDGVTVNESDLATGSDAGVNFCVWRDSKLVMTQANTTDCRIRDLSGNWTTITLPGPPIGEGKNTMVEFRDSIYVAHGSLYRIDDFDSPTASIVYTNPNGTILSCSVLGDNLYYPYYELNGQNVWAYIGMYEPDDDLHWHDQIRRIDQDFGGDFMASGPTAMVTYRNRLYVGGGKGVVVTHSIAGDPSSAWYEVMPRAGTLPVSALRVV